MLGRDLQRRLGTIWLPAVAPMLLPLGLVVVVIGWAFDEGVVVP